MPPEFMSDALDDLAADARETAALIPCDPEILALADAAGPLPQRAFPWDVMEQATGISRDDYFTNLSTMLFVSGERMVAGYIPQAPRARGARHRAYSEGAVKPPRRTTADERCKTEAAKWSRPLGGVA